MCNFTLSDIFYMQWHHLKTQFYNDVRIFQIWLVDSRRTRSAVCSCRARCPSRAISEHCSSWTVRCSRAAATTSWETKTNANRYCGYLLLFFQRFFKVPVSNSTPKNLIQLWYASTLLPRKWRNSFFNADYSPNTRNTQSGGDSPPPPYSYDETGNLAQGTTPPPLEKKSPDGIWWYILATRGFFSIMFSSVRVQWLIYSSLLI